LVELTIVFRLTDSIFRYEGIAERRHEQLIVVAMSFACYRYGQPNGKVTEFWTSEECLDKGIKVFESSVKVHSCILTGMSRPSREINVASVAASTNSVRLRRNGQAEDGIDDLERVDLLGYKLWKPGIELRDKVGLDLAVRMIFPEVFRRAIRVDTVSTIHTYQGHVLGVHNIWSAPEKIMVEN
jgi:hypothetical protein